MIFLNWKIKNTNLEQEIKKLNNKKEEKPTNN
jgi:uncharacterized membrane protein YciS (DUF1049 family)